MTMHPTRFVRMFFDHSVDTAEESIVRHFSRHGPIIAIGKPGESMVTPGAQRMYVADDQWQQVILESMTNAQAVVMQPGASTGVRWELEQIRSRVEPFRFLLCMISFWKNPNAYENICALVRETMNVELPRVVPFLDRPTFVYFDRDWKPTLQELSHRCPVWWPLIADAADLGHSLLPFEQGMHGGDREPPTLPRWANGFGTWIAMGLATVLSLLVLIIPPLMIKAASVIIYVLSTGMFSTEPMVTVTGHEAPYQIDVPASFKPAANKPAQDEFDLQSADGHTSIEVQPQTGATDLGGLTANRIKANTGFGETVANYSSRSGTSSDGLPWNESTLTVKAPNAGEGIEICRAMNLPSGQSILVIITYVGSEIPKVRMDEAVMSSCRLTKP